jgi:MFS superfamily sulfate permease-like transporter
LKQVGNTRKYKESAVIRDVSLFGEAVDWFTLSGAEADQGILMIRIEEPLYFTNIKQLQHLFQKIEIKSASPVHAIIIDASGIPNIDASALQILGEMVEQWERRNITVCFVKLRPTFRHLMVRSGLIGIIGEDRIFTKKHEAVDFILSAHVKKHKS